MICVLLSTYNGEKYLGEQLESLRNQKGVELKILIRDDGSKDSTIEIIKKWQSEYPHLIDFIQGENVGFARSFTQLLQSGVERYPDAEYYAFCDQDDIWLPEKLYEAVKSINYKLQNKLADIPVCYASNLIIVNDKLEIINKLFRKKITKIDKLNGLLNDYCTGCTMVFNKTAIQLYIGHEHKFLKYHDKLLGMICLFMGEFIYDNRSYIMYRQHGGNQIGANTSMMTGFVNGVKRTTHNQDSLVLQFVEDFLNSYKTLLNKSDVSNLSKVLYYRKIKNKLFLIFNPHIHSSTLLRTFILKIKILLNKL